MDKIELKPYENRIVDLWQKYKDLEFLNESGKEYRKSPLLPDFVWKDSLLFVGINPSFNPDKIKIADHELEIGYYPQTDNLNEALKEKGINYFEKFKDVAAYCNLETFSHLDMLFIRETKQSEVVKLARSLEGSQFIYHQLMIFNDILHAMQPKMIVVANAYASEFFGKKKSYQSMDKHWIGYNLDFEQDFDESIGTYRIPIGPDKKMRPIIFSGMLSGQRALDLGSLERLKWQVKMLLHKA